MLNAISHLNSDLEGIYLQYPTKLVRLLSALKNDVIVEILH